LIFRFGINNCYAVLLSVATHLPSGIKVAVKILNKAKILKMDMAEKVRREINILKMCSHPHVIQL
jgi:5'-AMP-activated protein kinase catalytic alpha subunit